MSTTFMTVKAAPSLHLINTLSVGKLYIWESFTFWCHLVYRISFHRCWVII